MTSSWASFLEKGIKAFSEPPGAEDSKGKEGAKEHHQRPAVQNPGTTEAGCKFLGRVAQDTREA